MTVSELSALGAITLVVGFFMGSVGVGGILLVPAMVWLGGVPIHQATATALFSFLFSGFGGTWLFQRRGSIDWNITRPVLAGALIFSYLGAKVNAMVDADALTLVITLVVISSGFFILLPTGHSTMSYRDGRSRRQQMLLLLVGGLAGFGSGLSGAGGPLFSVPMMLVLHFVPLTAIGAGQVLQIIAALLGTLGNLRYGSIDFPLAGWLILFEMTGMLVGARVAHRASVTALRLTAASLCVTTGILMLLRSI